MNISEILFCIVSFITVFIYYAVAQSSNWKERDITDMANVMWSATLSVVWSIFAINFRNGPPISYVALLPILPTALIYGKISEMPGLNKDLQNLNKTPQGIAALSSVGVIFGIYLIYILFKLIGKDIYSVLIYFLPLFIYAIWLLTWINIPLYKQNPQTYSKGESFNVDSDGKMYNVRNFYYEDPITYKVQASKYRMHHWMLALIGFLISKHPTIISDLGLGIFWGVFIQEVSAYGIDMPAY